MQRAYTLRDRHRSAWRNGLAGLDYDVRTQPRTPTSSQEDPPLTDTLEAVKTYKQFIGGDFVDAADGRTADVINPANDQVIANVPASSQGGRRTARSTPRRPPSRPGRRRRRRIARS